MAAGDSTVASAALAPPAGEPWAATAGGPQHLPVPNIVLEARLAMRTTKAGALPCFTGPLKQQGTGYLARVHLLPLREAGNGDLSAVPWSAEEGLEITGKVTVTDLIAGKKGAVASSRATLVLCAAADEAGVRVLTGIAGKLQKDSRVVVIKLTSRYELPLMPPSEQALHFWQLPAAAWTAATQGVPGTALLGAVVPRPVTLTLQPSANSSRPGEELLSVACWTRLQVCRTMRCSCPWLCQRRARTGAPSRRRVLWERQPLWCLLSHPPTLPPSPPR